MFSQSLEHNQSYQDASPSIPFSLGFEGRCSRFNERVADGAALAFGSCLQALRPKPRTDQSMYPDLQRHCSVKNSGVRSVTISADVRSRAPLTPRL